jgi:biotin carboxylase
MATVGLILPTSSYRGPDFVAAAHELSIDLVVVSDGSFGLTSGRILDVVESDCDDAAAKADALVEAAQRHPLDAVVGVDDAGVVAAALAAETLGLAHNSPTSVGATRNKLTMRRLLQEAGVPQPRFLSIEDEPSPDEVEPIGFPLVVKPLSLSGSRGVIKVSEEPDLAGVMSRVRQIQSDASRSAEAVLIEEYLAGPEIAVEALLGSDGIEVLAVFDKPDPLDGPYFEETLYVSPSRHDASVLDSAIEVVEQATRALGLVFGPVHAELRLTADGPRIIEVAARSIGGLCGRSLKFGMLNQSLEVLLLRAALGMNRRGMRPVEQASGAMMNPK